MRQYPKLNLMVEAETHFVTAALVNKGPSSDHRAFEPMLQDSARHVTFKRIAADKGYDSERNHRVAREEHCIRSTIIPVKKAVKNGKASRAWPKAKYRRQMKKAFPNRLYKQRWQIESVIARIKKRLSPTVRARKWQGQEAEAYLRVATFDLMLAVGLANA